MEKLYTVSKNKPGTDCGSDHQLLIAKFKLKLKKAGKTTRLARYNSSKILYEYTVEVMNRFKGLDLVNRLPKELWTQVHNIVQKVANKTSQRKRNARRQSGCLRRLYK